MDSARTTPRRTGRRGAAGRAAAATVRSIGSRRAPAAVLALLLAACGGDRATVRGSGEIVQERRAQRHVGTVEVDTGSGLAVTVLALPPSTQPDGGPGARVGDTIVWVEAPADLTRYVESRVVGDVLRIAVTDGVRLRPAPTVEVHVADLKAVRASGAGSVRVDAEAGLGALELDATDTVRLSARGDVDRLELSLGGTADAHLFGLAARTAVVEHAGSGDGWLLVSEHLEARVASSGDVFVDGGPSVAATVTGSGEVLEAAVQGEGRTSND